MRHVSQRQSSLSLFDVCISPSNDLLCMRIAAMIHTSFFYWYGQPAVAI